MDNSVSGGSRNGVSLERRNSDPTDEFPQVRAVSGLGPERDIHSPTSSDSSEEGLFFLPGQGQALTRADLTRFFAQPSLVEAVGSCWDVTVALLAREFSANAQRCAELVDWLGDGQDAHPDLRLAQIVADILKTHPLQRLGAASHQEAYLRTRGVKFRQSTPDEFIAAFVVTIITALDSRPIENWGGWFGAGLKREEQFQGGKVLTGCLAVFRGLLEDPEGLVASASEEPERKGSTFDEHDVDYIARLRAAALGTVWEDEIDFQKLLRNPAQQAKILFAYGRRTGSSDH